MKKKIAILGGGNIGKAIANGLLNSGKYSPSDLIISDINIGPLVDLKEKGVEIIADNTQAVAESSLVILSVQPGQVSELIMEIRDKIDPKKHIVASVITAYEVKDLKELFGKDVPIVRVMPNTAIAIRESMTCLATESKDKGVLEEIKEVFDLLGTTLVITERLMSAATILGACGIAYFLRYIRAASQGGIQVGFSAKQAQLIAAQTAKGAASLLLQKGNHPEDEIDKVTTPRGCTIAGLNEMEHFGLSSAVIKGIITSFNEIEKLK
jgi:pyrroline-5-carboxylate reductase